MPGAKLAILLLVAIQVLANLEPATAQTRRLVGLRGAITASSNSPEAITSAVSELMLQLIQRNNLEPAEVVAATFTATADLNALFPASVLRRQPGWETVALLDMQQMAVRGDLPRCIRVLLLAWLPVSRIPRHVYLGEAKQLRPDRSDSGSMTLPAANEQPGESEAPNLQ